MTYRIPFNRPSLTGAEYTNIAQAIANGHLSGDGPFARRCQDLIQQTLGVRKALLTTSCTHALEMCALLLGVSQGDEVIVPSFTFVSTVNAFVLRGARPVFIDIRPDTLNLDESRLQALISRRTKAIVPVHYAGVGCEMDTILATAAAHGLPVVEDNAHGLLARYKGRLLGTFGCLATQSFHETKNVSCGEGGALLLNEEVYSNRAEVLRDKGTDRSRFFRGQIDKYTWQDVGSSYHPSELCAAFLLAQLEALPTIQEKRRRIWEYYYEHLQDWAADKGVRLPVVPQHCQQSYHMFYMLSPSVQFRSALIDHLRQQGILAVFHYLPLHLSSMGRRFGGREGECPVTESVSDRLLRLPFYNDLSDADLASVVTAIKDFGKW